MRKPKPVVTETLCTVCGLNWDRHGEKPTLQACVELLLIELAQRPTAPYIPYGPWTHSQDGAFWEIPRPDVQVTYLGTVADDDSGHGWSEE